MTTMIKMKTQLLAAAIVAGLGLLATAPAYAHHEACRSAVATETHGSDDWIETDVSDGGQMGVYQDGDGNWFHGRVKGCSRLAVGQFGDEGTVITDIEGGDNNVGIDASNGAEVALRAHGYHNGTAVYANGGRTKVDVRGRRNQTVIYNTGGYANVQNVGSDNFTSVNINN